MSRLDGTSLFSKYLVVLYEYMYDDNKVVEFYYTRSRRDSNIR